MNRLRILCTVFFATLVAAHAAVGPIRIEVEQTSKSELAGAKGGGGKAGAQVDPMGEKTQHRELKIKVVNNSNEAFSSLTVKYWFFGRDMKSKSHDIQVLKEGERKCSLAPRATEMVESESVSTKYVEEHTKAGARSGKGGGQATKVPASGQKLTSYAVKVLNGTDVVAEYYSEDSLKQKLGGAAK